MPLSIGIIGLPNVGKSTIFNALCAGKAAVENYPFCTIEPNQGIVAVPDPRLEMITELSPSKKVVPAFIQLFDIAGLAKNASKGEGLGNQFLGHIRTVNAVAHVVRCFDDPDVVHVDGTPDPVRDAEIVETELIVKDLETVERALEKIEKAAKTGDKDALSKSEPLKKARSLLEKGAAIQDGTFNGKESAVLRELGLLTSKPVLYIANVDEQGLESGSAYRTSLEKYAAHKGRAVIALCGKIEAELTELPPEEQKEFLESIGRNEPGLNALVRAMYSLLGLQTFYTLNENENHAWTFTRGTSAPRAAGKIHSDFEKGFIRADVYRLEDLERYGSMSGIRNAGKLRSEGHEYVVQDGDILYFKFNV
ncbi:MAG: redox-regulated ATPase YchF [Chitinivibrionales bacterium]|nr:redox-regulated ATPase YchF [Chitinivibrionales bacterium]